MLLTLDRKNIFFLVSCAIGLLVTAFFVYALQPPAAALHDSLSSVVVDVSAGAGFLEVANKLEEKKIIRSSLAFNVYGFIVGAVSDIQPGRYMLDSASSVPVVLDVLIAGPEREVKVVIPEGATVREIDALLSAEGIIRPGVLLHAEGGGTSLEGRLFPDTYNFFRGSSVKEVIDKLLDAFEQKAVPLLASDPSHARENLILASILEKEVPDYEERRIVGGILKKRLAAGMPLQVDATVCYLKKEQAGRGGKGNGKCYPLTPLDFKIDSPYNTYLQKGLPPGPIGSPGGFAVKAAVNSVPSPYWFYLSDPETGKTIFSKTFEEHSSNRAKYLLHR
jgi:UPF0755 protein